MNLEGGKNLRKKLSLLIVCSFVLITGCSQAKNSFGAKVSQLEENLKLTERLNDKESTIVNLTKIIEGLEKQVSANNKELEIFHVVSNMSREFVQAHTSGDKEKLRQLLSEENILVDRDSKLYSKHADDEYEWLLFSYEKQALLHDWVIQGYQYDSESNTFYINIREFYIDENGENESPPTFLGLTFKLYNEEWKIFSLGFDV